MIPNAAVQYWAVTPSDAAQVNGPIGRLFVNAGAAATLALVSGDGSAFSLVFPVAFSGWLDLPYPITTVKATGTTATNIVAAGWGSSTTTGVAP